MDPGVQRRTISAKIASLKFMQRGIIPQVISRQPSSTAKKKRRVIANRKSSKPTAPTYTVDWSAKQNNINHSLNNPESKKRSQPKQLFVSMINNMKAMIGSSFQTSVFRDKLSHVHGIRTLIDEVTGYDRILHLKQQVDSASAAYDAAAALFKQAQLDHQKAIDERASLQRSLQSLLSRKATWTDDEISSFTALYKSEIRAEAEEKEAKQKAAKTSQEVDASHSLLVQAMRERYQGEQAWSDKIRAISTAGTIALMAFNILLFIYVQSVKEPRKRAALLKAVDEMIVAAQDKETPNPPSSAPVISSESTDLEYVKEKLDAILNQLNPTLLPRAEYFTPAIALATGAVFSFLVIFTASSKFQ